MIKLSRLTDYAVLIMAEMAREGGARVSAARLAEQAGLPEPTVAKILKILTKHGLIRSVRGVNGGYVLESMATDINVTAIIEAMEGPIALTACADQNHENCALEGICALNGRWTPVNNAIKTALSGVTLADMVGQR